ncbi:hypothetical protein BH11ARM1_BH11ARM1_15790 [soil metagenome]
MAWSRKPRFHWSAVSVVRILLDENLHERLADHIIGHEAIHVHALGWKGLKNGQLLKQADASGFACFLTADKNLRYQQSLEDRKFFVVILDIHPNVLENQIACLSDVYPLLDSLKPSEVAVISKFSRTPKPL